MEKKFIDLGLPSGTLWARQNEKGHFTFGEAKEKFGDSVPSIELWDELRKECDWNWDKEKKGYTVTGKNGNSIFLPAAGYWGGSNLNNAGSYGNYWSSSLYTGSPYSAWYVYFTSSDVGRGDGGRYYGQSVRLVKISNKICNSMRKIPFDIKYRPEIESGKYRLETQDGHPIRVICWDKDKNYTWAVSSWDEDNNPDNQIVALASSESGCENVYVYWQNGQLVSDSANIGRKSLVIVTDEPEWTEFEKEFDNAIRSYRCEDFEGDYFQWIRMRAKKLLEIAKAQK